MGGGVTPAGVLIVSETAGVAQEAADSALLVSPLDLEGTARALDMPAAERTARLDCFRQQIQDWTAADWLEAQLAELGSHATAEPAPTTAG